MLTGVAVYLCLLAVSHFIRARNPDPRPLPPDMQAVTVRQFDGHTRTDKPVVMAYQDTQPHAGAHTPVILLIHGSPAPASAVFKGFIRELSRHGRVLAPDLPGFGYSSRDIPHYGFVAHADYLRQFIDRLNLGRVHLVAYSMGGGAAIRMAVEEEDRVASLVLVSSLGVQDLELLGDYHLNHVLHGAQLLFFWTIQELLPHMGYLDRFVLNRNYARNFYDSDQRPLRSMLGRIRQPTLILHGRDDRFVLPAVAAEHSRLVPQSRLEVLPGGHLMVFRRPRAAAEEAGAFVTAVQAGGGVTRSEAENQRIVLSRDPAAAIPMKPVGGYLLLAYSVLIALATLISEDLACIGAGLLAARGVIGLGTAIAASFAGIVIGDLLLFAVGRYVGRAAVARVPLKWFLKTEDLDLATEWFNAKGPGIVLASRFLPGSRLPTYLTAGLLGTNPLIFLFYFCLAALLWTPALVGLAALLGHQLTEYYPFFSRYALWMVLGMIALLIVATRVIVPMFTFRGRRLLLARYRKLRHWEFWPFYIVYLPVIAYICILGLRRGGLTLFTATNPGMPAGGIVGESKTAILDQLAASGSVAEYRRISRDLPVEDQLGQVDTFMQAHGLDLPVVFKPDIGERGTDVAIIRNRDQMRPYFQQARHDVIVQRYIAGREFGIFYYRYPGRKQGKIFSIVDKQRIFLTGDGRSTLETLILKDARAVCLAPLHFREHRRRLYRVPSRGERVELVSVGAHARGTVFLDANHLATDTLAAEMDRISRHFQGFYFGRYDVRVPSAEDLQRGEEIRILELNGVTSEAGHVYDPSRGLLEAWRILMRQWKIAVEIGKLNRDKGAPVLSVPAFFRMVFRGTPVSTARGHDVRAGA